MNRCCLSARAARPLESLGANTACAADATAATLTLRVSAAARATLPASAALPTSLTDRLLTRLPWLARLAIHGDQPRM